MLLRVLLITFFVKQLVWSSLVPLWHFPDEQAHFGQIAFLAENGRQPFSEELDLTEEIRKSEELLGTERDILGINKFTYHPEYRIEYTDSYIGKYEKEIQELAKDQSKRNMVKSESSHYPPFYYQILSYIYRLNYNKDLISRVFIIRILQLLFSLGTVYVTWCIGKLLFPKTQFFAITLSMLVAFHPMFSFVSAGINSDNIANFVFTFYLLISLKLLKNSSEVTGFKLLKLIIALFLISLFAVYLKPQFILILLLTLLLLTYVVAQGYQKSRKITLLTISALWLATWGMGKLLIRQNIGPSAVYERVLANMNNLRQFIEYLRNYAFPHVYREVLPWYWGIYDWLGVTYPRTVHRIINWTILFSLIGFAVWVVKSIKERKWPFASILFLLLASGFLFLGIYLYDWLEWWQREIHLGVQGRYFFPVISSHMTILLLGWQALFPKKWHLKEHGIKILGLLMVMLNFYGLYTVAKTYYDILPVSTFVIQVSQYKPWFFKGFWLVALWITYIIVILKFLIEYIRYLYEKKN